MKSINSICSRLTALGVPHQVKDGILDSVSIWVENNGEEWTVSRLKLIKQLWLKALQRARIQKSSLSNEDFKNQRYLSSPLLLDSNDFWISHKKGVIKGHFKYFFRTDILLSKKSVKKAYAALLMYTNFVSSQITHKQRTKFLDAVQKPYSGWLKEPHPFSEGVLSYYSLPTHEGKPKRTQVRNYLTSPSKRMPVIDPVDRKLKTVPESNGTLIGTCNMMLATEENSRFLQQFYHLVPKSFKELFDGYLTYSGEWIWERPTPIWIKVGKQKEKPHSKLILGKLGISQEPGYKLRVFANPNRLIQVMLDPLKQALMNYLQNLRNDFTHNQNEGAVKIQQFMIDNPDRPIYAFDLSNATDTLPLSHQIDLLRVLFPEFTDYIDCFQLIAEEGYWDASNLNDVDYQDDPFIKWVDSQPLGTGPSFGTFAIYHHAIVRHIAEQYKEWRQAPNFENLYFIVGDDIVITDERVANDYYSFITKDLGCEISKSKSIMGTQLTEFVGHLISQDFVIPSLKYRQVSDYNFVDIVRQFGMNIISQLRPRQKTIIKIIADFPEPFGLGLNPKGLPLETRLRMLQDVIPLLDKYKPVTDSDERPDYGLSRQSDLFHPMWDRAGDVVPDEFRHSILSRTKIDQNLVRINPMLAYLKSVGTPVVNNVVDILNEEMGRLGLSPDTKQNLYTRITNEYCSSKDNINNDPRGLSNLDSYEGKLGIKKFSGSKRR